mmetsp:Transcript_51815/g.161241  ORF Transcript_51815/g.161241 Transcript_51815/m.161241 type:complete len:91 (+) Transcript_51815:295-567(+)
MVQDVLYQKTTSFRTNQEFGEKIPNEIVMAKVSKISTNHERKRLSPRADRCFPFKKCSKSLRSWMDGVRKVSKSQKTSNSIDSEKFVKTV